MITSVDFVLKSIGEGQGEFAVVKNPAYVFPDTEYYKLAEKVAKVEDISAILMDMDGTTTTTEELCIYSLEQMVRRMSGKLNKEDWIGLDQEKDFPNIIGNSTTKHVEYLIETYKNLIDNNWVKQEFVKAANWTINYGNDEKRKQEVIQNLKKKQLGEVVTISTDLSETEVERYASKIGSLDFVDYVNLGVDIYYEVYHRILSLLKKGEHQKVQDQVFGGSNGHHSLIAPMPGIPVLLPLLKGWLGDEASKLAPALVEFYKDKAGTETSADLSTVASILSELSAKFTANPIKLGLVTSSIFYEAEIVIAEVMNEIKLFISKSDLSDDRKQQIIENLSDYHNVYDAFVTASDSSEIRLKPHRDLYSIALHQAGVAVQDFNQVIGFEDSQSGTVAIRAAGIGCCVAVPFAQTGGHNLEAATHTLKGGVPQAIIDYNLFLNNK